MNDDGGCEPEGQLSRLDQCEEYDQLQLHGQQLEGEKNISNNVITVILWVEIPHASQSLKICKYANVKKLHIHFYSLTFCM